MNTRGLCRLQNASMPDQSSAMVRGGAENKKRRFEYMLFSLSVQTPGMEPLWILRNRCVQCGGSQIVQTCPKLGIVKSEAF